MHVCSSEGHCDQMDNVVDLPPEHPPRVCVLRLMEKPTHIRGFHGSARYNSYLILNLVVTN
jgi:hypothetical protein